MLKKWKDGRIWQTWTDLIFIQFGLMCVFRSHPDSSVCSSYQEGLGGWTVGQDPPCTLHPTTCGSPGPPRGACRRLSPDWTDSSTRPWCSLSYRDRSVAAPWCFSLFNDSFLGLYLCYTVVTVCFVLDGVKPVCKCDSFWLFSLPRFMLSSRVISVNV